ncbi:MAG: hypothetical protein P8X65_03930 [Syntrophobacterales bacterium]
MELLNPRNYSYDFNQVKADVLVLGSFGKSVFSRIYPKSRVTRNWRKVAQINYYDVYMRCSSNARGKNPNVRGDFS